MPNKREEHSQIHFFGWIWLLPEESYVYVTKISSYFLFLLLGMYPAPKSPHINKCISNDY